MLLKNLKLHFLLSLFSIKNYLTVEGKRHFVDKNCIGMKVPEQKWNQYLEN